MTNDYYCENCGTKMDLSLSDQCPICGRKAGAIKESAMSTDEHYAGFWVRFIAFIIDTVVLLIPVVACFAIAGTNVVFAWILTAIVTLLYFAYFESSGRQGTYGKSIMGLKVITTDGNQLTFPQACIRFAAKFISALILDIGFIMIGFTERKQGLHDFIAQTLVVKK
jgi:uncharacterized RDD family membrane protein YckC